MCNSFFVKEIKRNAIFIKNLFLHEYKEVTWMQYE